MGPSDTFLDQDALDIKTQTCDDLDRQREALSDPMFQVILETKQEEEQKKFGEKLKEIEAARLALDNAKLKAIADKLKENAVELKNGAAAVNNALQDLKKTKEILEALAAFLAVVARIVAFVV
jgi:hypothetical protein